MSEEEKNAIKRLDYICDFIIEHGQYNADVEEINYFSKILKLIEKQTKEIEELKATIKSLRDELLGDRMEQLDDYVIYLQDKYLKMLGEEE